MTKLPTKWTPFRVLLTDLPENAFKNVVGAFGWVISWKPNGVTSGDIGTEPRNAQHLKIEVRNIRYERVSETP